MPQGGEGVRAQAAAETPPAARAAAADESAASATTPVEAAAAAAARAIDIRRSDPIPLTAGQEAEVRELYHRNVRACCADEIRAFATCSSGRTFSISWACRAPRLAMNACMLAHAGRAAEDRAREQWFASLPERQRQRDEQERWKEEQRRKKREWWDLDEEGRRVRR